MSPAGSPEEFSSPSLDRTNPRRFFNPNLSTLQYNKRLLEEADNSDLPLFERVRFLSSSGIDLDEFLMMRIAGLRQQEEAGDETCSQDGLTPAEQFSEIYRLIREIATQQYRVLTRLRTDLSRQNVHFIGEKDLSIEDVAWLKTYFFEQIFCVLTPIAIDLTRPFPHITDTGITLGLDLVRTDNAEQEMYALLPIPRQLSRFVRMPESKDLAASSAGVIRFLGLETIVGLFIDELFPGYRIRAHGVFQFWWDNNAESIENTDKFVRSFEPASKKHRRGRVIRLEIEKHMPEHLRHFIDKKLQIGRNEILIQEGIVGLSDIAEIITKDRPDLLLEPYSPRFPDCVKEHGADQFSAITQNDILVHHPYESFDVVLHLLHQAAADPDVISIKWTLCLTRDGGAVVEVLKEAAKNGKSVTAIIDQKSRFGIPTNARSVHELENAGVCVLLGSAKPKSHANIGQIVRREAENLISYNYIGTGFYHTGTTGNYVDLSFLTADKAISRDVTRVFDYITSSTKPEKLKVLSISPHGIRDRILDHIREEIYHAKAGRPAQIWLKTNSITDCQVIDALYEASGAGVEVDLVVRGKCSLRPEVPGLSENIRVKSIIGRFFEHARIFCFGAGHGLPSQKSVVYISSADLGQKNLDRRVEVMVPISAASVHQQIQDQIMQANLVDNKQSWRILSDGLSERFVLKDEKKAFNMHTYFMNNPSLSRLEKSLDDDFPSVAKRV